MARPNLDETQQLVPAPTRLSPEVMARVKEISDQYEWPVAKTLRKLIERGLEAGIKLNSQNDLSRNKEIAA